MSATDSVDEKAPTVVKKRGFFSRKPKVEKDSASDNGSDNTDTTVVEKPAQLPPVDFLTLFRFAPFLFHGTHNLT